MHYLALTTHLPNNNWYRYTISDFDRDSAWTRSLGEKIGMIHFRNGHWHAECDPKTGRCSIHYDRIDPHESLTSLVGHMSESKIGATVLAVIVVGVLDQIFTGGQIRKALLKSLSN